MSYKLFTDKPTLFECKLELDGASMKETVARLVLEGANHHLMFTGRVTANGVCEITVGKLRGLLDEDASGTMRLEVIAEDTYFQPWTSPFNVEASRKLAVEVKSQATVSKPALRVEVKVDPLQKLTESIVAELRSKGVTVESATAHKKIIRETIDRHTAKGEYKGNVASILPTVVKLLAQ